MFRWLRFPSSAEFTLGLIVLGALPVIKSPFAVLAAVSLDTRLGTVLYLATLAILGSGFLIATRREDQVRKTEQQEAFGELHRRFDEIENDRTRKASEEAHMRASVSMSGAGTVTNTSLKQKALALSDEILRFLLGRQSNEPPLPRPETWDADVNKMVGYSKETMGLYSQKFASRALAVRDQLAKEGVTDRDFDIFVEHPTNPIGIRNVGERMGALAEQLPNA